nr:MAP/microtubule affinity-regulating kinase 4-like [Equus asinus]
MLPGLAATSAGRQPCPRDYQLRRTLGEGSFGIVKLALHVPSGTEVAVKIIQKKEQSAATAKRLLTATAGGVMHRDLKPENVLLDPAGSAKLADFGFCSLVPGGPLSTFCGIPGYMAPEVMQLQPYAGPPADVWSLGVLLHAMLAGSLPFSG